MNKLGHVALIGTQRGELRLIMQSINHMTKFFWILFWIFFFFFFFFFHLYFFWMKLGSASFIESLRRPFSSRPFMSIGTFMPIFKYVYTLSIRNGAISET